MLLRSVLGVAAGVAVLVGLGWITQEEQQQIDEETKKKEKISTQNNITQESLPPPDKFSWHKPISFYIRLLVPDGWHIREDEPNTTIYVTKEELSKPTETCLTGFTVSSSQQKPKDYVPKFLKSYPGILRRFGKQNISDWETKGLRRNFAKHTLTFEDNSGYARVHVKCCIIHNEVTGTVYMVMFETKKTEWDHNWTTFGEVMTNNLLLPSSL